MAGRDEHGERGGSDAAVNGPAVAQIVKIGGAALTDKGTPECLREGALRDTARMLRRVMDGNGPARRLVVVHGAGSFGHIQASRSGVAGGGLDSDAVRRGFVETRLSVTKLNHHVVAALAKEGLPAVGVPICGYWTTSNRQVAKDGCQAVVELLRAGFLPVLHGDAVLDKELDCTILSGDVIIKRLAEVLKPQYVVFLTDVAGVYDRPPSERGAELIKRIFVDSGGQWSAEGDFTNVRMTPLEHDTTGGIAAKVQEAANIAMLGIDVIIAQAGSTDGEDACRDGLDVGSSWMGTQVLAARGNEHRCLCGTDE